MFGLAVGILAAARGFAVEGEVVGVCVRLRASLRRQLAKSLRHCRGLQNPKGFRQGCMAGGGMTGAKSRSPELSCSQATALLTRRHHSFTVAEHG